MRKVVVNTTPLIALSYVGQLDLLNKLYGEVEVMILAQEVAADVVIIDDANAKKHAKYLKLPVTGTLGILIKAKQRGYIDELKPILQRMVEGNIYIAEDLIDLCLKQVGEA